MIRRKDLVGDFARDLIKWFTRNVTQESATIRAATVLKVEMELSRCSSRFRSDPIGFSAKKSEILETVKREAEAEFLTGLERQLRKALSAVDERKAILGMSDQHDVKNNVLRLKRRA